MTASSTLIPVGVHEGWGTINLNVTRWPHTIITGVPGSGKTNLTTNIIIDCLNAPDIWKQIHVHNTHFNKHAPMHNVFMEKVIAEKATSFSSNLNDLYLMLFGVNEEMFERYTTLMNAGAVNVDQMEGMGRILVVIDDTNPLVSNVSPELEEMQQEALLLLSSIARCGRAVGIHVLLTTQTLEPFEKKGTPQETIFQNCENRISLDENASVFMADRMFGVGYLSSANKPAVQFITKGPEMSLKHLFNR